MSTAPDTKITANKRSLSPSLYLLGLALGMALLFTPQFIGYYQPRPLHGLWNLGHLVLFAALASQALKHRYLQHRGAGEQVLLLLFTSLVLGLAIELIQAKLGRNFSLSDIGNNCLGAVLPWLWQQNKAAQLEEQQLGKKQPRTKHLAILWLAAAALSNQQLLGDSLDSLQAKQQFPVLSDFSQRHIPLQHWRWGSFQHSAAALEDDYVYIDISGNRALEGAALIFPERDWRGWSHLNIEARLSHGSDEQYHLKVFDADFWHTERGYFDQFNRFVSLNEDWTHIRVAIKDIAAGPRGREMNLSKIHELRLYTVPKHQHQLHIRKVWLD